MTNSTGCRHKESRLTSVLTARTCAARRRRQSRRPAISDQANTSRLRIAHQVPSLASSSASPSRATEAAPPRASYRRNANH
jgi:hypothetical protein